MDPKKPDNFPGAGPKIVERERVAKKQAAQRVRTWTVQNETTDVLGRMIAGAARRILDSAPSRETRV